MHALAGAISKFLSEGMVARLQRTPGGRVQLVFVGPPTDALTEVFLQLTAGGTGDWMLATAQGTRRIVVLFVDGITSAATPSASMALSQHCTWDYAVTIRNSVDLSVTLATPEAMDTRHESITNATETIGVPRALLERDFFAADPWPFIVRVIAAKAGTTPQVVRDGLGRVFRQAQGLDPAQRDLAPWTVANAALLSSDGVGLVAALGLPSPGADTLTTDMLRLSQRTLGDFAALAEKAGLDEAERSLRVAGVSVLQEDHHAGRPVMRPLAASLRSLFQHLRKTAGSAATFSRAPAWYFRPNGQPTWWEELPHWKIRRLLDELGASRPTGRLRLSCASALNSADPSGDEPLVVMSTVTLQASDNANSVPVQLDYTRRVSGQAVVRLPEEAGGCLVDDHIPAHDRPVVYKVESPSFQPATLSVISLNSFVCHGHAHIHDSISNPPPSRQRQSGRFEQEISVPRSGVYDMVIYTSPDTTKTTLVSQGEPRTSGGDSPTMTIDVDDRDELDITLRDAGAHVLGEWTVRILVQEPAEGAPHTRFEALVRANQDNRPKLRPVLPLESRARWLEDAYLSSGSSWRGVLAGYSSAADEAGELDWTTATLGDLAILDVRCPVDEPPPAYVAARDAVRETISALRRTIAEVSLTERSLATLVEKYMQTYLDWLGTHPEAAAWTDCIAIHAPSRNIQAGEEVPTSEPVALFLSPLHPLRLGWHAHAQRVLEESLSIRACPAAGLLDPHASPSIVGLPVHRDGTLLHWRAFFSVACNEPHWQLLWSREHLGLTQERGHVLRTLALLGITPSSLVGGFSRSQAKKALEEVTEILPARARLRLGLVGSSEESANCVEGLVDWCRSQFAVDEGASSCRCPVQCEVLDLRSSPTQPSAASLAMLSEDTSERVRWFHKGPSGQGTSVDLVLLDDVGTLEPRGVQAEGRAPMERGALFRINLRRDIGRALVLQEARIGIQNNAGDGLAGTILRAIVDAESLSTHDAGTTHLQFEPNQLALGQRLERSLFVAATSNQVDPACFIRGARALESYLWDYEVPGTPGYGASRAGYYLIETWSQMVTPPVSRV